MTERIPETSDLIKFNTTLDHVQTSITRMDKNQQHTKSLTCLTLVGFCILTVSVRGMGLFAPLCLTITFIASGVYFYAINSYYATLEKLYKTWYTYLVKNQTEGTLKVEDYYLLDPIEIEKKVTVPKDLEMPPLGYFFIVMLAVILTSLLTSVNF